MTILCKLRGHRPSHHSQLDLSDLQVKTYCSRCGAAMVRLGSKWKAEGSLGIGAAWIARGRLP